MFTPILDSGSSRPLYEQLYRYIRDEIEGGRLRAGERLPSKRALAARYKKRTPPRRMLPNQKKLWKELAH